VITEGVRLELTLASLNAALQLHVIGSQISKNISEKEPVGFDVEPGAYGMVYQAFCQFDQGNSPEILYH